MCHSLSSSRPVSVLAPVPPWISPMVALAAVKLKLSFKVLPIRVSISENSTESATAPVSNLTLPALAPVICQSLFWVWPVKVSVTFALALPIKVWILLKVTFLVVWPVVNVPSCLPVSAQVLVFSVASLTKLLLSAPPSILVTLPPTPMTKISRLELPMSDWMPLKLPK